MLTNMILLFIIFFLQVSATVINIPADQPTIQDGIDVSVNADTVLVQPGTYIENINYNGKNITVGSLFLTTQDTSYISQTIIDGNQNGSVVIFMNEEDSTAVLIGFKVINGIGCGSWSWWGGGGITINSASPIIQNCEISNNSCQYRGGGFAIWNNSNPIIKNCKISNNTDWAIYINRSDTIILNTLIIGNDGGLRCYLSNPIIINTNIINNIGYGIKCLDNSNPILLNSIVWDNDLSITFFYGYNQNSITISYSDIQGGEAEIETNNNGIVNWLEGNIDLDPLFIGTGDYPFSLQDISPCINAGTPDTTGLNLPEYDLAGNPRLFGGRIDMGTYENQNVVVGVNESLIPNNIALLQNYPNPFNPTTTISFNLTAEITENTKLTIYNIKGQRVKSFPINQLTNSHVNHIIWNGDDENGKPVSSGIYLYKLNFNGKTEAVRKCLLLK